MRGETEAQCLSEISGKPTLILPSGLTYLRAERVLIFPALISYLLLSKYGLGSLQIGCLFRFLTGLECWGCGVTRAMQSILTGDWKQAVAQNWLAFPTIFIIASISVREIVFYSRNEGEKDDA
jgi:hypothetical protein